MGTEINWYLINNYRGCCGKRYELYLDYSNGNNIFISNNKFDMFREITFIIRAKRNVPSPN
jgi:hypothetical protein